MKKSNIALGIIITMFILFGCKKDEEKVNPEACFSHSVSDVTVNFNSDCSKNVKSYFWDFGDNFTSQVGNPVHSYETTGSYTVTLKVDNNDGTNSKTETIILSKTCVVCYCEGIGEYNDGYDERFCGTYEESENFKKTFPIICDSREGRTRCEQAN